MCFLIYFVKCCQYYVQNNVDNILLPYQRIRGAAILYAFGSLVTLVAAVVINNR